MRYPLPVTRALRSVATVAVVAAGVLPALGTSPASAATIPPANVTPTTGPNTGPRQITITDAGYLPAFGPTSATLTLHGTSETINGSTPSQGQSNDQWVSTFDLTAAAPGAYDVALSPGSNGVTGDPSDTCASCFSVTSGKPTLTKANNGDPVPADSGDQVITVKGTNLARDATVAVLKAGSPDPDVTAAVSAVTNLTTATVTLHFPHNDAETGQRVLVWTNRDGQAGFCGCLQIAGSVAGTKPGPPLNVHAVGGNSSAKVTWDAPASDGNNVLTGFTVAPAPSGTPVTVGPGQRSAIVSGLHNGTAYTFTVKASNGKGSSPASAASNSVKAHAPSVTVALPKTVVAGAAPAELTMKLKNDTYADYSAARLDLTITGLPGLNKNHVALVDTGAIDTPISLHNDRGSVVGSLPDTGTFSLPSGAASTVPFTLQLAPSAPSGTVIIIATLVDATDPASPKPLFSDSDAAKVQGRSTAYVPMRPVKFVDTHHGVGVKKGKHHGDTVITVPPIVPDDARAVVLDVGVDAPTKSGTMKVFRTGTTAGNTAMSYYAGEPQRQVTVTQFDARRHVTLRMSHGAAFLVVSVIGYQSSEGSRGGRFVALPPRRISDTGNFHPSGTHIVSVKVPASVPAHAVAVAIDVTATHVKGSGSIKVYAQGAPAPVAAALTWSHGKTHSSAYITRMSKSRRITLRVKGRGGAIVDLVGYYAHGSAWSGRYVPVAPTMIVSARRSGTVTATVPSSVPASASAAYVTLTEHAPSATGNLRAYAAGAAEPITLALAWAAHTDASNLAVVPIGPNGQLSFSVHGGSTVLRAEVIGYTTG